MLVRGDDLPRRPNGLRLLDRFGFHLNFRPLKQSSPTLRGLTLRMLDIQDVTNIAAPSLCQRMDGRFFGDVQGQFAAPGTEDILAKLDFVGCENLDALLTARNGHIPLLLVRRRLHCGIGEQHMIDRFALRGVGCDGVAAHELAEVWGKHSDIGERIEPYGIVISKYRSINLHNREIERLQDDPDMPRVFRTVIPEAASIAGGTSEIQKTIIGERILGLPR